MYWQLNDVWAAPSWSSIDYNLNWKMLHYFAKRFFAPLIVSMYVDQHEDLQLFIVSDLWSSLPNLTLSLQVYVFGSGFQPIYTSNQSLPQIPALSSTQIQLDTGAIKTLKQSSEDFIIRAIVDHEDTFAAILLPDKLYSRNKFGQVKVVGFKMLSASTYLVDLKADNIVPVVWLDLTPRVKNQAVLFHFDDNAFAMVEEQGGAVLQVFDNPKEVQITVEDVIVKVL
uniref:Beta-mannosidase n=1 Tax=Ditylenchus dipsaci TaxID=166011 RepID=A0A915ELK1_9BILA